MGNALRIAFLTALTMVAFAANSVLNRLALVGAGMDAVAFGSLRLTAGAVTLAALCLILHGRLSVWGPRRMVGVMSLLVYIFGFSFAYLSLDAGLGALILFGTVQITMFAGALTTGERPSASRWTGTIMAASGLVWLLWTGTQTSVSLLHAVSMACAGAGWGIYSLAGRASRDALQNTAANFVLAAPIGIALLLAAPHASSAATSPTGLALAIVSGALTSGLGYALWYSVLPRLATSVAAISQLTVPAIATAGGILLLNEALTSRFITASALILGGVVVAVTGPKSASRKMS